MRNFFVNVKLTIETIFDPLKTKLVDIQASYTTNKNCSVNRTQSDFGITKKFSPIFPRLTAASVTMLRLQQANSTRKKVRGFQSSFDCHIPFNLDVLLIISVRCHAQLFDGKFYQTNRFREVRNFSFNNH